MGMIPGTTGTEGGGSFGVPALLPWEWGGGLSWFWKLLEVQRHPDNGETPKIQM